MLKFQYYSYINFLIILLVESCDSFSQRLFSYIQIARQNIHLTNRAVAIWTIIFTTALAALSLLTWWRIAYLIAHHVFTFMQPYLFDCSLHDYRGRPITLLLLQLQPTTVQWVFTLEPHFAVHYKIMAVSCKCLHLRKLLTDGSGRCMG